jgi:hypothetical protein
MTSIAIGIDCGKTTGVAIAENGKISTLITTDFWGAISILQQYPNALTVVELPTTRHVWHDSKNTKTAQRTGFNVGSCLREAELIIKWLNMESREYFIQRPQGKISAEEFKKITGFTKSSNAHTRDAGMLVHGFMLRSRPD